MTFAELTQALSDRGFSYLTSTQRGQYINDAFHELEEEDFWKTREATATGTPPLAISDLGTIEMVVDSNSLPLEPFEWSELVQMYGDLSLAGTPFAYYTGTPSGVTEVATYPVGTASITVQYWKVSADLTGSDVPATIPTRFHKTIVNIAVRDAYRDKDRHGEAEGLQAQIDRDLTRMRTALLTDQAQGPGFIRILAGSEDS